MSRQRANVFVCLLLLYNLCACVGVCVCVCVCVVLLAEEASLVFIFSCAALVKLQESGQVSS